MKTLNNKSGIRHISLAALICLAACTGSMPKQMYTDNPTSGEIAISVDESFKPFIESEVYVFQQLYPDAKINVRYTSEQQAMNDMLFDTTRLAIIGRDLNDFEKYVFDTMRITPAKTKIAKDALCFIANHENQDTSLYTAQLKQIFRGEATNWKQINKKSTLGNIRVVFDQNQSSNVQMLYRLFAKDNKFPDYCYAAKSNEEVIKFVKSNKNALGVIGAGWISDVDDTTHLRFRS